jgi:catechol 2,3-dioxygenase-like lactoylglutathione lyase family enzyme
MKLRHIGIVVRDIAKAMAFYNCLGFNVKVRDLESGQFIDQVVGISSVKVETVKLINEEGEMIELLQYHSHPSSLDFSLRASSHPGLSHIAFTVDDVEKTLQVLELHGGFRVNDPVLNSIQTVKVAYCHDLEGNLLELVELAPNES